MPEPEPLPPEPIYIGVSGCARCGQTHAILARPLDRPSVDDSGIEWTHWGMCPMTEQPVLVILGEKKGDHRFS